MWIYYKLLLIVAEFKHHYCLRNYCLQREGHNLNFTWFRNSLVNPNYHFLLYQLKRPTMHVYNWIRKGFLCCQVFMCNAMFNRSVRCEETLESCGFCWEISSSATNWLTLSHGREHSLTLQVQYFKIRTELSLDGSLVAWQTQNAWKLHYQL